MQAPGVSNALKINFQPELKLNTGDFLFVNVVKRLIGDKWAVSIGGKIYPAISKTALYPGEKLKVLVEKTGQSIILKIVTPQKKSPVPATEIQQTGKNIVDKLITVSLIKSNLNIAPETVHTIRTLVSKYKRDDLKFIRSLVVLIYKNIIHEWDGTTIYKLFDIFKN
jgi:hypothetical protein